MASEIPGLEYSYIDSGGSAAIQPTVWLRFTETSRVPPTARLVLGREVRKPLRIIVFQNATPDIAN